MYMQHCVCSSWNGMKRAPGRWHCQPGRLSAHCASPHKHASPVRAWRVDTHSATRLGEGVSDCASTAHTCQRGAPLPPPTPLPASPARRSWTHDTGDVFPGACQPAPALFAAVRRAQLGELSGKSPPAIFLTPNPRAANARVSQACHSEPGTADLPREDDWMDGQPEQSPAGKRRQSQVPLRYADNGDDEAAPQPRKVRDHNAGVERMPRGRSGVGRRQTGLLWVSGSSCQPPPPPP
jgi:hypothetical protein